MGFPTSTETEGPTTANIVNLLAQDDPETAVNNADRQKYLTQLLPNPLTMSLSRVDMYRILMVAPTHPFTPLDKYKLSYLNDSGDQHL